MCHGVTDSSSSSSSDLFHILARSLVPIVASIPGLLPFLLSFATVRPFNLGEYIAAFGLFGFLVMSILVTHVRFFLS